MSIISSIDCDRTEKPQNDRIYLPAAITEKGITT